MDSHGLDLSRIRHDLRGPINQIVGYSELLLEDDALPDGFADDLRRIHAGGKQLIVVLAEYLDEAKFEERRRDLRRLNLDLRTPVNQIIGYCEMLEEQADAEARVELTADLGRIRGAAHQWLALIQEHLLPVAGESAAEPARVASPSSSPSPGTAFFAREPALSRPGKLLVVDDDPANLDLLRRRLGRHGFEVVVAGNGVDAIARLRAEPHDLVLLDLVMPGLDGYQVLAEMKADPRLRDLPVLMISGSDEESGIVRCIEAGADDYLTKPFNQVLMRARIGACLEKKRLRDHERALAAELRVEQERSERLLLNVLPQSIAERLKRGESPLVDAIDDATVIFADLVGFTGIAASLPAAETVQFLDELFGGFDDLADRHGVTKIKIIGDAWMAVSGVPRERDDHADAAADLALGLERFSATFAGRYRWPVVFRIGMHCGPVVAGVIGRRRFSYDLWGDTVNTASRMESHGVPGRIHVTWELREKLAATHRFERRGTVSVKGKGEMETWFLTGRTAEGP